MNMEFSDDNNSSNSSLSSSSSATSLSPDPDNFISSCRKPLTVEMMNDENDCQHKYRSRSPTSPTSVCSTVPDGSALLLSTPSTTSSSTKARRRGSARSVSSSISDWSTSTAPTSNTAHSKEAKKRQKNKFMKFAYVLLQFLERKDPTRFAEAKAVIKDCEEQKRRGQVDSVSESVKAPLKDLVGPSYWKEARKSYTKQQQRMSHHQQQQQPQHKNIKAEQPSSSRTPPPTEELFEPLSATEAPPSFSKDEVACLEQCLSGSSSCSSRHHEKRQQQQQQKEQQPSWMFPLTTKSCLSPAEEMKLRRERFWMLIRVLMKYLEKTVPELFQEARKVIEDCIISNKKQRQRHLKCKDPSSSFDYNLSVTKDIQREVKQLVGVSRWRRAEAYLAKVLLKRADEDAAIEDSILFSEYDLKISDDSIQDGSGTGRGQQRTQRGQYNSHIRRNSNSENEKNSSCWERQLPVRRTCEENIMVSRPGGGVPLPLPTSPPTPRQSSQGQRPPCKRPRSFHDNKDIFTPSLSKHIFMAANLDLKRRRVQNLDLM